MILCHKCNKETVQLFPEEQGEYEIINYCYDCDCKTIIKKDYDRIFRENIKFLERWNRDALSQPEEVKQNPYYGNVQQD